MFDQPDSFLSSSTHQQNMLWLKTALLVIVLHVGLLGIGILWHPAPPAPKPRSKVLVQTISLQPFQSTMVQSLPSPPQAPILPKEQLIPEPLPLPPEPLPLIAEVAKESPPLIQEEISIQTEVPLKEEVPLNLVEKVESIPQPEVPLPADPPVIPIKRESPPQSKPLPPSKPMTQKVKKTTPAKKTPPVKHPVEKIKKPTKTEEATSKATDEGEKKRQQERVEIEKKRQQEQAESEKKRQQEKAEAEKKRQQELAAAQEAARQREASLLTKAKENLAKMGETRDKISTSSSSLNLETTEIPKELGNLQVDALPVGEVGSTEEWGTKELSYSGEVASRLKLALRLPDYGAVKIKLTLDRTGKVIKVNIIRSESNKNKSYVESKIPTLLFPSFGQRFPGLSQKTFEITLQNDS